MARLITKFKYVKPNCKKSFGGYARYIATREGVDKIDVSKKYAPSTLRQKGLIEKILHDFPDSQNMLEYEDYLQKDTIENASEFIKRALEENVYEIENNKTYADYIATRPRAERFGSHGLFTDDGVEIKLSNVSKELNQHSGNMWTAIISLRREDAERLGFSTGVRWRDMLRTQVEALSENMKIPIDNLRWYAAFHNESHHPHVHLIVYSTKENEGYLTKKGLMNLRTSLAKDIFAQDLLCIYEKQKEHRRLLRSEGHELIAEIVSKINSGSYDNPKVEELLLKLSEKLSHTGGKKIYGYLISDIKDIVDSIVNELSADERIVELYNLWYEQKEEILRIYTQEIPDRIPLVQNKEFKPIKNAVIQEALNISADRIVEDMTTENNFPDPEPSAAETEADDPPPTEKSDEPNAISGNKWTKYGEAKILLNPNNECFSPQDGIRLMVESAEMGYTVAQYMLGKIFLRGEIVPKNIDYALRWLEEAVAQDNQYAEYLLGKTLLKGIDVEQDVDRAVSLLSASAEQGNRYAAYTLGKAYLDGTVILQDIEKALELLTQSADKEFTPAEYILGKLLYRGEIIEQNTETALSYLEKAADKKNSYAAYLAGKIRLTEDEYKDINKAVRWFYVAAEQGNDFAEYQLGKMFLYGKDIEKDYDQAIHWLTQSAEHGNQYAKQILNSIHHNRNWSAAIGSLRLLGHISRLIQNRIVDERRGKGGALIDRKLRRKIEEKKQAHGLKQ